MRTLRVYLLFLLFALGLCTARAQLSPADLTDGDEVELMKPAGEPVSVPGADPAGAVQPAEESAEEFPWMTVIIGVVVSISLIEGVVVYRWIKRRQEAAGE